MAAVSTELELVTRLGFAGPMLVGIDRHRLTQNFVGPGLDRISWPPRNAAGQTPPHRAPLPIRSIHDLAPDWPDEIAGGKQSQSEDSQGM
jgi:hypothetical protein